MVLTRIDAIPAGVLSRGLSGFAEGIGEQAHEIFTSRTRRPRLAHLWVDQSWNRDLTGAEGRKGLVEKLCAGAMRCLG
jgi:hypothetical protein